MRTIRALIFDFDGLILDTETPAYQSWQEIYAEYRCELSLSDWSVCIGTANEVFDPCQHLERLLGQPLDRAAILARRRQREQELISTQSVLPGVTEMITAAKARGLKIGLASSSPRDWVMGHLTRLGLIAYFDCVKASDDVQNVKPDPALYRLVLDELGVEPDQAVVFEDSPNGVLAAKRAGLFCIAVPNTITRHLEFDHADYRLSSLADLSLECLLGEILAT